VKLETFFEKFDQFATHWVGDGVVAIEGGSALALPHL